MSGQVIRFPGGPGGVEREPLLTMRDLVERYKMSERWFRYRLVEGMPAHRWGGRLRFRASEIEAWMDSRDAS